jgi:hypothetical protein
MGGQDEGTDDMAETRRCVGSVRFGIEAHDAPIGGFSVQASQKDGLSRMCTTHWKAYVAGLAREAKDRQAAIAASEAALASAADTQPTRKTKGTRPTAGTTATLAQEPAAD